MTGTIDDTKHLAPDTVLSKARGNNFVSVVVVGINADGEMWVSSSDGSSEAIKLLGQGVSYVADRQLDD